MRNCVGLVCPFFFPFLLVFFFPRYDEMGGGMGRVVSSERKGWREGGL